MKKPSEKEIWDEIDEAQTNNGKYSMTYEEGVEAALRWVLGETDSKPME